MANGLLLPPAI